MPRFRPLQVVMITTLLTTGVFIVQLGMPALASPDTTSNGAKSESAHLLSATSTSADTRKTEATISGMTTLVSVSSDGTQGNWPSSFSSISADGRYVAFWSQASTLVSGDTNGTDDVFIHDMQTGQTTRVSVASNGTQANGDSYVPSISADGRYVAFESSASNLVGGDTDGWRDIFIHDMQTGQTTRVSVTSNGTQANGNSVKPSISADGRYVAFDSYASNLVSGDTNGTDDVFIHDMQTGQTTRVSVTSNGMQANSDSDKPSISSDGRYVAFESSASNLVGGDTNGWLDVFIHDMQTGQTTQVSVASDGTQGNAYSGNPSISADGQYVAFESWATNLVSGDTNGTDDVFIHDMQTGQTTRVSVASNGTQANSDSGRPSVSADGRYVAFESSASNLVGGDTSGTDDVFIHDTQTGQTTQVSVASDGTRASGSSYNPSVSADGQYVAFDSYASNLVSGDTNNWQDVFVHESHSRPAISISHIEVTQAIQDITNTVPLIAGKPTVVRVYVDCGEGCTNLPDVSGVLRGYATSGELTGSPLLLIHSITAYHEIWRDQRGEIAKTINFILPRDWATGSITLTAEVAGIRKSENVIFKETNPVKFVIQPIQYRQGNVEASPLYQRILNAHWLASKIYPTNAVKLNHVLPAITWDQCLAQNCTAEQRVLARGQLLLKLLLRQIAYNIDAKPGQEADYIFGWLPYETYGGGYAPPLWLPGLKPSPAAFADDDPTYGPLYFAHEVAHLMGRPHTRVGTNPCSNPTPNEWSDWPNTYPDAKIQEWGVEPLVYSWLTSSSAALKNPATHYDYMSYCSVTRPVPLGPPWTSPHTYQKLYSEALHITINSTQLQTPSVPQPYLISSGQVFTDNTAILDPMWVVTSTVTSVNPPSGSAYCLETQDASDTPLASSCFDLAFVSGEDGSSVSADIFALMLPFSNEVSRVVLKSGTTEIAVKPVTAHAPTVEILSPNGGETWAANGTYTITWAANDPDGDILAYSVLYSPDSIDWVPVQTAITETHVVVTSDEIAGGSNARVRVLATDGVLTSIDESDTSFVVGAKAPSAFIRLPEEGATTSQGGFLFLQGYAYDLEDGTLEESALQWSSNQDGILGSGSTLLVSLSQGTHVITLAATDSGGNTVTTSINIYVGWKVHLPLILHNH
jgi:Tol biopolymer transport system component